MNNYIKIASLLFLFCIVACSPEIEEQSKPNIIYVLADDLGYGDIAAFNDNGKIKTPNIDRLAAEGIKFTDAHTSSAVCTPTRYGILTGRYNWRSKLKSGVLTGKSKALIPNTRSTVASMLKKNEYHTAFIGKWHLGWDWALKNPEQFGGGGWDAIDFENIDFSKPVTNTPNDLGFDYAYGHSGSLDMAPYVYVENGMPTGVPTKLTVDKGKYTWWREGPTADDFIHDEVTSNFFNKAMGYLEERSKEENPFFMYLALPSPHTPILPTEEWLGKSDLNPYADFVMMIDDYMGQLLSTIEKSGIAENTLVIFASDNGCSPEADFALLAEKGHDPSAIYRGHKADIFEGGHRVPFIARWPNRIEAGRISNQTISTVDLMATCADIVGYSLSDNEGEDSYSMVSLFDQEQMDQSFREATVHHSINGTFAIRKEEWKLIMSPGSGGWSFPRPNDKAIIDTLPAIQLYNLDTDPGEQKNLQAVNPDKVNELKSLLIKYIKDGRSTPGVPQKNDAIDFEWKQIDFVN